jgi:8-oxo-dGTP diphosphatase
MLNHNIAAKALLINEKNEILCIKRRDNDVHNASEWDFPGGRLEEGESPFAGLKRECIEEVNFDVMVLNPIKVHHFTRQDRQLITLIVFLCKVSSTSQEIKLSEEHIEYKWLPANEAKELIHESFAGDIEVAEELFLK